MKQEYLKYKYVIEIKYAKDYKEQSALFSRVLRYLNLEFDVNPKKTSESKKALIVCCDDDFDEDKVADYLLGFVNPDNLTIFKNEQPDSETKNE